MTSRNEGEADLSQGAGTRGLQRFAGWLRRYAARNERMRLCETLQLGGRRSVALIECDGQRYLAGLSASGVQTLLALGDARPRPGERP